MTNFFLNNYYLRRGLAFYIDAIIITIVAFIYLFIFDQKGPTIECGDFICWNTSRVLCFQILFYFVYFLLMEFFFKLTFGKIILGFLISSEIKKMFFWRILIRTLLRLLPLNIVSFYLNKKKIFWHESIPKIYTIKKM